MSAARRPKGNAAKREARRARDDHTEAGKVGVWRCGCCGRVDVTFVPLDSYDIYDRISDLGDSMPFCVIQSIGVVKLMLMPAAREYALMALDEMESNGNESRFISSSDAMTGDVFPRAPSLTIPPNSQVHLRI